MPGRLSIYTVFYSPDDYPGLYVLRAFAVTEQGAVPDPVAHTKTSLEDIRRLVPGGLVRMERSPADHPSIVESWL